MMQKCQNVFKWVTNVLYGVECFKMWFRREAKVLNGKRYLFTMGNGKLLVFTETSSIV